MPKITFTETRTVNDGKGTGQTFEAGRTYDLSEASCERWVRRRAATYAGEPTTKRRETTVEATIEPRKEVQIPDNWRELEWNELRALAKELDPEIRTKEDALAAVELEIAKRQAL